MLRGGHPADNHVRKASFSIPTMRNLSEADPSTVYHVTPNENDGRDTLHGGLWGTSRSGWCLLRHTPNELIFGLLDTSGNEGAHFENLLLASR